MKWTKAYPVLLIYVSSLILAVLPIPQLISPQQSYSWSDSNFTYLGNEFIEVGFSTAPTFQLGHLVNKLTGFDYNITQGQFPIFALNGFIRNGTTTNYYYYSPPDFPTRIISTERLPNGTRLSVHWIGARYGAISVTMNATLFDSEQFVRFSIGFVNTDPDLAIFSIVFPNVGGFTRFGRNPNNDTLVVPWMQVHRPYQTFGALSPEDQRIGIPWTSPAGPGAQGIPFLSFVNSGDRSGLYLFADDNVGFFKELQVNFIQNSMAFFVTNHPPAIPRTSYTLPYTIRLGVFVGGDWYDAAETYRQYVTTKWWTQKKLYERAGETNELDLVLISNGYVKNTPSNRGVTKVVDYNQFSSAAKALADIYRGVRLGVAWVGWERCGAVACWSQLFPPIEGYENLSRTIENFHRYDISVIPFAGGASYMSMNTTDFELVKEAAVFDENLRISTFNYVPKLPFAFMDLGHPIWFNYILNNSLTVARIGFDYVYFDGTPWINPNYKQTEYYSPGESSHQILSYIKLLQEIKQKTRKPIMMEARVEQLIPFYDYGAAHDDAWEINQYIAPKFGYNAEGIPFFTYVYHEYFQTLGGGSWGFGGLPTFLSPELVTPAGYSTVYMHFDPYYFKYLLARSLTRGEVPFLGDFFEGLSYYDVLRLPAWQHDLLARAALARATYAKDFLLYGKMVRPLQITSPIPRVRLVDTVANENVYPYIGFPGLPNFTIPSIVNGGWIAPDGAYGYIFININDEPVDFDVTLPAPFDTSLIYIIEDGVQKMLYRGSAPPSKLSISLDGNGVALLVVTKDGTPRAVSAQAIGNGIVDLYSIVSRMRVLGLNFTDLYPLAQNLKEAYLSGNIYQATQYGKAALSTMLHRLADIAFYKGRINGIQYHGLGSLLQEQGCDSLCMSRRIDGLNWLLGLLRPRILIDQVHSFVSVNWNSAKELSPNAPLYSYIGRLLDLYRQNGFSTTIVTEGKITEELLADKDLLVIVNPRKAALSSDEIATIGNFVQHGGSVLLQIGAWDAQSSQGPGISQLLDRFGITLSKENVLVAGNQWPAPYGFYYGNISSHESVIGIRQLFADIAVKLTVHAPAQSVAWSPPYTFTETMHGPFPVLVVSDYGRGRVFLINSEGAIQAFDYGHQPLVYGATKWLLDKSDRILAGNFTVPRLRVDVGSVQRIGAKFIWEASGLPVDSAEVTINGSATTTNASGWATFLVSWTDVGRVFYNVSSIELNGKQLRLVTMAGVSLIWDRVNITLGTQNSQLPVGSNATISWSGYYEYDRTPFLGTIILNDTTLKERPGVYTYTVSKILDNKYNLTAFVSNSVSIEFVQSQTSESIASISTSTTTATGTRSISAASSDLVGYMLLVAISGTLSAIVILSVLLYKRTRRLD